MTSKSKFPICGVYEIYNCISDKRYIGSAVDIARRWTDHKRDLRTGNHYNEILQRSWNKHGEEEFQFNILEECSIDDLEEREDFYIIFLNTLAPNGYNLKLGRNGLKGLTEERRKHLSEIFSGEGNPRYGAILTEETKNKISIGNTGKTRSEEFRKNESERMKGNSLKKGIPNTSEQRDAFIKLVTGNKFAQALRGKKSTRKNTGSKYVGVGKYRNGKFRAYITFEGKTIHLGYFSSEEDAAKAYNDAALKYFGENAILNNV